MTGWFKVMSWAMKPENSFKVFTMSTVPDTRWKMYSTCVRDFISLIDSTSDNQATAGK